MARTEDPATCNMVGPPFENTVAVPKNGWAAARFGATNPGEYGFLDFLFLIIIF